MLLAASTPPHSCTPLLAAPPAPRCLPTCVLAAPCAPLQELWGIFLAHVVELLHNGVSSVRGAAIDALDRLLTGALGPAAAEAAAASAAAAAAADLRRAASGGAAAAAAAAVARMTPPPTVPAAAPVPLSQGDIEHMLLVALESVYKEEREPDVRQGLLRVTLHVLQRHGEHLSAGWVPLLRLLEAVPSWDDAATISTAFQSVESICRCGVGGCVRCGPGTGK
jgi:hypothetical protein